MQLAFNPQMVLSLFSLFVALLLMAGAWRYRARPIVKTFLVAMLALAWWSLASVLEHASQGLAAKTLYVKMSYLGIVTLPTAWLAFTLQYADREEWLTRRNVAMLWELAGLREQAPVAEKGFSMLTAALKKKISALRKTPKQRKPTAKPQRTQRKKSKKAAKRKSQSRKSSGRKKRG
jgi:hypothetical protein